MLHDELYFNSVEECSHHIPQQSSEYTPVLKNVGSVVVIIVVEVVLNWSVFFHKMKSANFEIVMTIELLHV